LHYGALAGRDSRYIGELLEDWRQIVRGIERREVARVKALVESHVVRSNRYLESKARKAGLITSAGLLKQSSMNEPVKAEASSD
jgi:hypothetical protein